MLTIAVFILIGLALGFLIEAKESKNRDRSRNPATSKTYVESGGGGAFFGAVMGVLVWLVLSIVFVPQYTERVFLYRHEIRAVNDILGLKGSFVLASGVVSEEKRYSYYEVVDGGGMRWRDVPAGDQTTIYYVSGDKGNVVVNGNRNHCIPGSIWLRLFLTCLADSDMYGLSYDIYIPFGTLVDRSVLDGK